MVAVPEKIFEQLAKELAGSSQIGVYLEDYAYTNQVLEEIKRLGYEVISPFRASMRVYDPKKVSERLISLGIAFVSFAILFILEHILLRFYYFPLVIEVFVDNLLVPLLFSMHS